MCMHHRLRAIAGSFILLSLALAHFVDLRWLWFTAFIGVNLLQSSFTRWCLMEKILHRLNLAGHDNCACGAHE